MRSTSLLLAALCATAPAPAAGHDWYGGLRSPGGNRCCTGRDCRPVDHRYNPATGRLELRIDGVWVPLDPATLLAVPSPDGAVHACFEWRWMPRDMIPVVRCVILPGEA